MRWVAAGNRPSLARCLLKRGTAILQRFDRLVWSGLPGEFRPTRRWFGAGLCAGTLALAGGAAAREFWPQGARAAVSLTYDDGYDSQLDHALPLLDGRGLRGTFYLTVENIDARLADWIKVWRAGHEIGNHTETHACDLTRYSARRFLTREVEPSEAYFAAHFPQTRRRSYAYPCGEERLGAPPGGAGRYRALLNSRFANARTVSGGPNDPAQVWARRYRLNAYEPTYDIDHVENAVRYLDQALMHGFWAILVFHEILPKRMGAGDTSIAVHRAIVEEVLKRPLWCAPVETVFRYLAG